MGDLTRVTIDFDTSHLVFPIIISGILAVLGLAILIKERARLRAAGGYWRETIGQMDGPRFFGTILLTVVYFLLMVPVGNIWPNTGMGFLLCSVPFVFLTGLLYLPERSRRGVVSVSAMAVVAPTLVWWLFTDLFFLTLP